MIEALILAGERPQKNPFGVPYKALVSVCGKPMFARVAEALAQSRLFGRICVSTREELFEKLRLLSPLPLVFFPQASSPSVSVFFALDQIGNFPVFLTTADHALLTGEIVSHFLEGAQKIRGDLGVGVVPFSVVKEAYPEARRTTYRLREGRFCSANLYFCKGPQVKRILYLWREIEARRKSPLRIVKRFGLMALLHYLSGRLGLEEAFKKVSQAVGCRVYPVVLPFARAAVDVDDPSDLALAQKILACKEG